MTEGPSSPAEVARAYMAAFDGRDPHTIAGFVADDFVNIHTAALGEGCEGRTTYRTRLESFLASMPDLHYEVDDLVADGDHVAVFYTMTGRWQGEHPFSIRGAQHLVVRDGLIEQRTDYWDSAAFLAQVER